MAVVGAVAGSSSVDSVGVVVFGSASVDVPSGDRVDGRGFVDGVTSLYKRWLLELLEKSDPKIVDGGCVDEGGVVRCKTSRGVGGSMSMCCPVWVGMVAGLSSLI